MPHIEQVKLRTISTTPWFNDPVEMEKAIKTLKGLNQLCQARAEYGRFSPAPLGYFILTGSWHVDEFGQRAPVRATAYGGFPQEFLDESMARLRLSGEVHRREQFSALFALFKNKAEWGYSMGGGQTMPHAGIVCTHCKQPWQVHDSTDCFVANTSEIDIDVKHHENFVGKTLAEVREMVDALDLSDHRLYMRKFLVLQNDRLIDNTCKDPGSNGTPYPQNPKGLAQAERANQEWAYIDWNTYVVQPDDVLIFDRFEFTHRQCQINAIAERNRLAFSEAIKNAGLTCHGLISIPNQYGSASYRGTWFLAQTDIGLMQMGWRRRVISTIQMQHGTCDYDSASFVKSANSHEEKHVDNYEDLTTFLRELKEQLNNKTASKGEHQ